ncbi:hypothetical protein JKP88DRAFT_260048 [Tribonema minus]|uniref:Plastid lipid-associated protein/fibrillin conserved domain-containing protein n=1 Tax=Tribonema minus TaxID=303371 RepID=A0A835ZI15_9STRA|nr:hypothetical protein JKP88DRAFT_260048 [Tribonema minus]
MAMGADVSSKADVKSDLLSQIDLESSAAKRIEVNELILKLEPLNPTDAPAQSTQLNGVWEFLYTGGISPGMLAIQMISKIARNFAAIVDLKSVTLTIRRDQPRVEAAVTASLLGREGTVKVRTRLRAESDARLTETYEEAEIAGMTIPIPAALQLKRTLFITYLDDDIVIARDNSGSPDLLVRKAKDFSNNVGVPSYTDSDLSPGSG